MGKIMRTPEEFARIIAERGFIVLEEVRSQKENALMQCKKCGHVKRKRVQSVVNKGYGCAKCAGNERLSTQEFNDYVAKNVHGYTLISEVNGAFKKAKLRCDFGHEYEVNPIDFIHKGYRCPICKFIKMSGSGHWNYNADLSKEERETTRAFPGYTAWQFAVKKRDNFSCQCCGDSRGGNLVSHHLDGWNIAKEKRLDVDNGVTLCEDCHKDFHGKYGYGGNTKTQYDKWLSSAENSRRFLYAKNAEEAV
ncbi:HNH endonuclease [Robertmurraya andreesenii]|uniref:Zn-ribbon and HTH transcriptional regulator n=1 Tax=Anoxybacillus andreesenii TaxID=1325932 RepID=A0ABT9V201_9BACL|nr:HNH endonuclease signature motif containing protein [Robertmurraya andreesenii]MDQ0154922.1 putative Zn-ribbon and HTH transcriptional regulator [Robertmurraya andreesenii]